MKRPRKPSREYRWSIYRLRTPAQFIGTVYATDDRKAIEAAVEQFGIDDPQMQKRLLAQRDE